jgi:hypothetical protein
MATTLPLRMPLGTHLAAVVLTVLFDALIFGHFARAVMFASTLHGKNLLISILTVYDSLPTYPTVSQKVCHLG